MRVEEALEATEKRMEEELEGPKISGEESLGAAGMREMALSDGLKVEWKKCWRRQNEVKGRIGAARY